MVSLAKREGNFKDLNIPSLSNAWEISVFKQNRKKVFNALIYKEMLKSLAACLQVKELISDMLESYEEACGEDVAFEAAMTVFDKKKRLDFIREKQS